MPVNKFGRIYLHHLHVDKDGKEEDGHIGYYNQSLLFSLKILQALFPAIYATYVFTYALGRQVWQSHFVIVLQGGHTQVVKADRVELWGEELLLVELAA